MPADLPDSIEPVAPSEAEVRLAQEASMRLSRLVRRGRSLKLTPHARDEETVEIPAPAAALLLRLLRDMAAGHAVTLIPVHAELTTQQAADLLGVSRPFLIKQIAERKLPCRRVGSHRRVRFQDLMDLKHRMDAARRKALDDLAADGQGMGVGY